MTRLEDARAAWEESKAAFEGLHVSKKAFFVAMDSAHTRLRELRYAAFNPELSQAGVFVDLIEAYGDQTKLSCCRIDYKRAKRYYDLHVEHNQRPILNADDIDRYSKTSDFFTRFRNYITGFNYIRLSCVTYLAWHLREWQKLGYLREQTWINQYIAFSQHTLLSALRWGIPGIVIAGHLCNWMYQTLSELHRIQNHTQFSGWLDMPGLLVAHNFYLLGKYWTWEKAINLVINTRLLTFALLTMYNPALIPTLSLLSMLIDASLHTLNYYKTRVHDSAECLKKLREIDGVTDKTPEIKKVIDEKNASTSKVVSRLGMGGLMLLGHIIWHAATHSLMNYRAHPQAAIIGTLIMLGCILNNARIYFKDYIDPCVETVRGYVSI